MASKFKPVSSGTLLRLGLVAAVVVAALLLGFAKVGTTGTVVFQIVSALAGAWLGALLGTDRVGDRVRNQARPAIRRLFDQAGRLGNVVTEIEARRIHVQELTDASRTLDPGVVGEWLRSDSSQLRNEIDATSSSIQDWSDLAEHEYAIELEAYADRKLPGATENEVS